jgi:hypothetical protein
MAQSDQIVQNATFPSVRADINDNLAALFSQSSGNSAPTVTVAYQPWIDTSGAQAVWKVRNSANTAWVTIGTFASDGTFGSGSGGVTSIANGGTGQTTAALALAALLPTQTGNAGKALVTSGSVASWGAVAGASGASIQVFPANATYTPTAGKTSFLVLAVGGGGGGGGASATLRGSGGGGAGTAIRLYTSAELGSSASITIGAAGTGGAASATGTTGGNTTVTPGAGSTGVAIQGTGGGAGAGAAGTAGAGGGTTNSLLNTTGGSGSAGGSTPAGATGGTTLFAGGNGSGGAGGLTASGAGTAGTAGAVLILEW